MTTTDRNLEDTCHTCKNTWQWHLDNQPHHPFNDGSLTQAETFGVRLADGSRSSPPTRMEIREREVPAERSAWPFDPVLRQALINKGVITPEDLIDARTMIEVVTEQYKIAVKDRDPEEGL